MLISIVGTIGRTALVPAELKGANIARALARMDVVRVGGTWVAAWLDSPWMQDRLVGGAREVARKTLNLEVLRTFPVPIAPEAEAQEINARVTAAMSRARSSLNVVTDALGGFGTLDSTILAKAFRGELVPQDPNDEPASVLLERIRSESGAQTKATTRRGRAKTA